MNRDSDQEILQAWYEYAAAQSGSVGVLLRLLRERQHKSDENQRAEYGASIEQFQRLCSMRLPRENQFTSDALRMANACRLTAPMRFVQDMVLAKNINRGDQESAAKSYRAAFDDVDDLDDILGE